MTDLLRFAELSVASLALAGSMLFVFRTFPALCERLVSAYGQEQARERATLLSLLSLHDTRAIEHHRELIERFDDLSDSINRSRCHDKGPDH
jgi:hypothetical protein